MRAGPLIALAAFALAGCADAGPTGGVATYDALKRAGDACEAKGGKLVLNNKDSDPTWIGNYVCEKK